MILPIVVHFILRRIILKSKLNPEDTLELSNSLISMSCASTLLGCIVGAVIVGNAVHSLAVLVLSLALYWNTRYTISNESEVLVEQTISE